MILYDIIWLFIISFVWAHSREDEKYWASLKFMHNFIYYLVFLEIIFKCYIECYIMNHYKNTYGNTSDLFNLQYYNSKGNQNSMRIPDTTGRT